MARHLFAMALVLPFVAGLAASSTWAKEPGIPRGAKTFERLDKDKNGKLELNELQPAAARRFMGLDRNEDDAVSAGEVEDWLRAMMERRRDRIMKRMDADQDGAISRAELDGYVNTQFKLADADTDGGVTREEARSYHLAKRKQFWADRRKARSQN